MSNKKLSTETRKWATPGRRCKVTPKKWEQIMESLSHTGNLQASAAANGVSVSAVYKYMKRFPEAEEDYEIARNQACLKLEQEAYRRAVEGTTRNVYYQGVICGEEVEYSDALLRDLLKANMPTRYSQKSEVNINHEHNLSGDAKSKLSQLLGITNQSEDSEDGVIEGEWSESNDDDED